MSLAVGKRAPKWVEGVTGGTGLSLLWMAEGNREFPSKLGCYSPGSCCATIGFWWIEEARISGDGLELMMASSTRFQMRVSCG